MKIDKEYKVLYTQEEIEKRIIELADQITKDYKDKNLFVVGILKGAAPFMMELIKHIDNDSLTMDFMSVSSYGNGDTSTGVVRLIKDLDTPLEGKDVLIVEDIIDTGNTMKYLKDLFNSRNPLSLKTVALFDKPKRREVDLKGDYIGFTIDDKFIFGFGLDYEERYRQIPYVLEVLK